MAHGTTHGVKRPVIHSIKHGGASTYGASFDGTSRIYRPASAADWVSIGYTAPAYRFPLQELSGSIVDEVRGSTMAAVGAVTYQQSGTETTYASKGVGFPEGTASLGFSAIAGELHNLTYQSVVIYAEFEVISVPTALRSFIALTGAASMYVGLTQTAADGKAHLTLRPNGAVNGTYNYADGKRHPVMIEHIIGASVIDHATSRFRFSTDKEQVTGTTIVSGNGTKGLATGGSASLTSAPVKVFDLAYWVGTDAESLANTTTPKTALQRRGWTVTGY